MGRTLFCSCTVDEYCPWMPNFVQREFDQYLTNCRYCLCSHERSSSRSNSSDAMISPMWMNGSKTQGCRKSSQCSSETRPWLHQAQLKSMPTQYITHHLLQHAESDARMAGDLIWPFWRGPDILISYGSGQRMCASGCFGEEQVHARHGNKMKSLGGVQK